MGRVTDILNNVSSSLKTDKDGYSARKLSAFAIIIMVVVLHIKWFKSDHWEYIQYVLTADYLFILVCLGLATAQQLIEFKNGKKDEEPK